MLCIYRNFYKYTCSFLLFDGIVILIGKNNTLKKATLISINLIKGTVLGRALRGANTFSARNRLPNLGIWFVDIFCFFLVFLWFSTISCSGDSKSLFNYLNIFKTKFWSPSWSRLRQMATPLGIWKMKCTWKLFQSSLKTSKDMKSANWKIHSMGLSSLHVPGSGGLQWPWKGTSTNKATLTILYSWKEKEIWSHT